MSRPWMPLYVGDYIADTAHLSAAESGAYLHLLMHYWLHGGPPPDDDAQLARIAKMRLAEWKRARPTLQAFFQDGWKHKRVEFELTEAARISAAGRAGGKASGEARRQRSANDPPTIVERPLNDRTNDQANDSPTICEALHLQRKKDAASPPPNPEKELYDRGKQVLGEKAGGLIKSLLKAKGGDIALARAAIETASTKSNPREYIGAIARGPANGQFNLMSGMEGIV